MKGTTTYTTVLCRKTYVCRNAGQVTPTALWVAVEESDEMGRCVHSYMFAPSTLLSLLRITQRFLTPIILSIAHEQLGN